MEVHEVAGEVLREHAYLVARGVRPLAVAGHAPADTALRTATRVESHAVAEVSLAVGKPAVESLRSTLARLARSGRIEKVSRGLYKAKIVNGQSEGSEP